MVGAELEAWGQRFVGATQADAFEELDASGVAYLVARQDAHVPARTMELRSDRLLLELEGGVVVLAYVAPRPSPRPPAARP